jgi:hypothetical protein
MTPFENLLARLPGARRAGNGWSARCPAHDDRRASLSIAEGGDGTVLLKCHAGCSTAAVLAAVGLSPRDLFPATAGPTPARNGHCKPANGALIFLMCALIVLSSARKKSRSARPAAPVGRSEPCGRVGGLPGMGPIGTTPRLPDG